LVVNSEVSCRCRGEEQVNSAADAGSTVAAAETMAGLSDESYTVSAAASAVTMQQGNTQHVAFIMCM